MDRAGACIQCPCPRFLELGPPPSIYCARLYCGHVRHAHIRLPGEAIQQPPVERVTVHTPCTICNCGDYKIGSDLTKCDNCSHAPEKHKATVEGP